MHYKENNYTTAETKGYKEAVYVLQEYCLYRKIITYRETQVKAKTYVCGARRSGSGVSGMARESPVAPDIIKLSRLSRESLNEVLYEEPVRELFGVAATNTEKYFSCSRLEVVSPLWDAGNTTESNFLRWNYMENEIIFAL